MKTFTPKGKSQAQLIAEQELINAKNFQYETNQKLQSLSEGMISLSLQHEKVKTQAESNRTLLLIDFENLRETILDSMKKMDQRVGDVETLVLDLRELFTQVKDQVKKDCLTKESFSNGLSTECRRIDLIEKDLVKKQDYLNLAIHQLKSHLKNEIEGVKRDLTPVIPEIDPVDLKIEERFKVMRVDFEGLIREIALLKKGLAYDQKKFENIYTLIERLKEGK